MNEARIRISIINGAMIQIPFMDGARIQILSWIEVGSKSYHGLIPDPWPYYHQTKVRTLAWIDPKSRSMTLTVTDKTGSGPESCLIRILIKTGRDPQPYSYLSTKSKSRDPELIPQFAYLSSSQPTRLQCGPVNVQFPTYSVTVWPCQCPVPNLNPFS